MADPEMDVAPPWTFSSRPALVEDLQVAPDGHVGNAQLADEVRDAHGPVLAHAIEDERLTLSREHQETLLMTARSVEMDTRPHPF